MPCRRMVSIPRDRTPELAGSVYASVIALSNAAATSSRLAVILPMWVVAPSQMIGYCMPLGIGRPGPSLASHLWVAASRAQVSATLVSSLAAAGAGPRHR